MKNNEIFAKIEAFAPLSLAESWDKIGIMIGDGEAECKGILATLDVTIEVAMQAVKLGCNLIIAHHPLFFTPCDKIDLSDSRGRIIEILIKNDISVYSAHTNLDKADGGIGVTLAKMLNGQNIANDGIGVLFEITPTTLKYLAKKVAETLGDKTVKFSGEPNETVCKIFLISGGGADNEQYAHARECADVFISGDVKHHIYIDSQNDGFPILEFSHYYSEIIVSDIIIKLIAENFPSLKIKKANQACPYRTLEELNNEI